jgi:hypothetical protein|tara:strand:- start:643 stop:912 length:270 start_codon:yes stop_codon:yes gene_type:complete
MVKAKRVIHRVSIRPFLDKLLRTEVGDGSISAFISSCINEHFDKSHGLAPDYISKLKDVATKEKRNPQDMARVIIEEYLDKVQYIRTFK